ncbi:CLUMA_CG008317, isoform A [Clunio marinus]|uniref:Ubiquinone biosynthesis O-methyltransferase, mitochondrial n=1 Tax=Clunio marinus TaxID=568069 RepID=A0A1J1I3B0_9DIPT|nr:CLUMA_CG008317, isoform A [Clunio marinus]
MPSAEKVSSATVGKLESAPPNEPKAAESTNKELPNAEQNEKSVPAIQQVISIISNKIRNLEKRKNKLDGYIKEEETGKELSAEQQRAVSKYDEVMQQLSLSKEFCKQFQVIATSASKDAKREARKSLFSRQQQESAKVREVLMIQDLLQRLKDDVIRNDFLNERNGACSISKVELEFIEKFAHQVIPARPNFSNEPIFSSSAKTSADHFSFLIDGRNRQFMDTGITYEKGKELFNRIQSCGYWEKDVKIVEVTVAAEESSRAETDTPNTEDLESKDEKSDDASGPTRPVSAPAPTQVPTPIFNGNLNVLSVQQRMPQAPMGRVQQPPQPPLPTPTNVPLNMKTTVTAVENAYFNQMNYSQTQMIANSNGMPIVATQNSDFGTNFSFLQDSELDSPAVTGSQQQQNIAVNVIQQPINQVKHSPVQHQQMPIVQTQATHAFKNANFHSSSAPIAAIAAQITYPPGLKVQSAPATHIPVNYQQANSSQHQQQLCQVVTTQQMIPKQQQQPSNGASVPGFVPSTQTPPNTQQNNNNNTSRPAYPTMVPKAQYQQQQQQQQQPTQQSPNNTKQMENKTSTAPKHEGTNNNDGMKSNDNRNQVHEKEKNRDDYQQQPQIDTWTNETAATSGGGSSGSNNYSSKTGGFNNRNNRGGGGGTKYNNYRNSQQSRNYNNENGNGDLPREGSSSGGTFFRNNERFNGSSGGRYEGRGGGGGNYKNRDGNYRTGSGRFAGSASAAAAHGSSNPVQRKLFTNQHSTMSISGNMENVNDKDVQHHAELSENWWDLNGPMKGLHAYNMLRVPFIRDGLISMGSLPDTKANKTNVLEGVKILEIGSGAGILTKALGTLKADVTALDPSEKLVTTAKEHLKELNNIEYVCDSIESHVKCNHEKYDAVVASEVLEHVVDQKSFLKSSIDALKPGGSIFITTLNKTQISWLGGIIIAENFLNLVPKNTHDWNLFISPGEVEKILKDLNCTTILVHGARYEFWRNAFAWSSCTDINYVLHAVKNEN